MKSLTLFSHTDECLNYVRWDWPTQHHHLRDSSLTRPSLVPTDILYDEDNNSFVRGQSQHLVNYNHSANFESKHRQWVCVCQRPVCVSPPFVGTGDTHGAQQWCIMCVTWCWAGHDTVSHTFNYIINIANI